MSSSAVEREVELAVYRQALERARADFQSFAHSVSHDLRAPLRAIQGFSKILLEDFKAQLDPEAQTFLSHIVQNTQTLSAQLDDLLRFSRAGKAAPSKIKIDTGRFLRELIDQLDPDLPPNFTVTIGELPEIHADPAMMRQVFAELIQNAAKFTAGVAKPAVEISGRSDSHAVTLIVRDNGAGFDPAHAPKLFQVFQKLHSATEFPGNGIGLAIVRRIVEAHGGCIDADGQAGKGAAIYVALPPGSSKVPLECVPRRNPEQAAVAA